MNKQILLNTNVQGKAEDVRVHFGIYGFVKKKNKILIIKKSRGPYQGLLDLPGGSPIVGESIFETLEREIKEETGVIVKTHSILDNFSVLVPYKNNKLKCSKLYHIALIYKILYMDDSNFNPCIIEEDVTGALWVDKNKISKKNSSPILLHSIEVKK